MKLKKVFAAAAAAVCCTVSCVTPASAYIYQYELDALCRKKDDHGLFTALNLYHADLANTHKTYTVYLDDWGHCYLFYPGRLAVYDVNPEADGKALLDMVDELIAEYIPETAAVYEDPFIEDIPFCQVFPLDLKQDSSGNVVMGSYPCVELNFLYVESEDVPSYAELSELFGQKLEEAGFVDRYYPAGTLSDGHGVDLREPLKYVMQDTETAAEMQAVLSDQGITASLINDKLVIRTQNMTDDEIFDLAVQMYDQYGIAPEWNCQGDGADDWMRCYAKGLNRGDVNADNYINIMDAIALARIITEDKEVNVTEAGLKNADLTRDGAVTAEDLNSLLRRLAYTPTI